MGGTFDIEWIRRYDLPFQETEGLYNPLNENKPIKISRDGQELPLALGLKLTRMFDERADADGVPRPPPAGTDLFLSCNSKLIHDPASQCSQRPAGYKSVCYLVKL